MEEKLKTRYRVIISVCSIAAAAFMCFYAAMTIMRYFWFLPGTYINNIDVSWKTFSEAEDLVEAAIIPKDGYSLKVYGRKALTTGDVDTDVEVTAVAITDSVATEDEGNGSGMAVLAETALLGTISGEDISLSVYTDISKAAWANRETDALSLLKSGKRELGELVSITVEYDAETLKQITRSLTDVSNGFEATGNEATGTLTNPRQQQYQFLLPEDAHIQYNDDTHSYEIVPETDGTVPVDNIVFVAVRDAVKELEPELTLGPECYLAAGQTADSMELKEKLDALNRYAKSSITYDMGDLSETVDVSVFHDWIDMDTLEVNRDAALSWVSELSDRTDTAYTDRTFEIGDRNITVAGPYGFRIDDEAETDLLISDIIYGGEPITREPVYRNGYLGKEATRNNELGKTFVEVDLTKQHVYLYENGELIGSADCVTGDLRKGCGTPPGIYPLTYKERNAVLRGPGYATPVKFWMPFNGGIGLHDATWRSSFGGSIYKTNGSHGCVNLPYDMAKLIFEHAPQKGMAVVCHY